MYQQVIPIQHSRLSKCVPKYSTVFVLIQPFPCGLLVIHGDCPGDSPAPTDSYFPRKSLLVLTLPLS